MIDIQNKPQVVVIGGGPAGATVATLLAQQGVRVELFEREKFPRFHIGESLIPETYWVLKRLNMLPKLKDSQFIKKYSVQFVSDSGKQSAPFYFHDNKDHDCSQTWQVRRSEFDEMMLRNAEEHGVKTHEGVRVLDVLFDGDRATGIQIMDENGEKQEVYADVVVDASGQSSLLLNKLKLKVPDPSLNKGSIWTYYQGAKRDAGRDEGATTVLQVENKKGWFWYIPLHDDIVSIGVVGDFDYLFKGRGSHEEVFAEELERCPAAKMRIEGAQQVTKIFATKDFTYKSKQASGDGWVLIGDALGFLDPLYSSGVLLALKSGELAADAIVEGLKKGDTSRQQLGHWEPAYLVGMERMRKLVCEYYDGFNFGRFVRRFPDHRGDITDLLIGDLFKDSLDKVFESIATMKTESEAMAE
ncbi:NAD(P)/FAD-dependent oxidoreductase [Blastopirellula marina]|uniref:NAD(P)/FAD-dependent oxidoreductase n=1 Tax=Blastopirellula marina TaxID=124 RepID=A0A2S8EYX8_9BACT|nr:MULTISPECIES: NAD(P)/FAD-dependent oxidoreductase [Pirellulaceae]PQO25108.1 NAD(P)/FAD-dependent oxidoreductase [Blastopirellula marina]RCS40959.1 NAD(P)/FAD-dependent oxidoreductase [Bremerella cremea]